MKISNFYIAALIILSACGPMDTMFPSDNSGYGGYGGYNGYNDPYYDSGYGRDRYEWERQRREKERLRDERHDLERERRRLEEERRQHERERRRREEEERRRRDDNCPPGFRPGNHKCTDKERRRGCKDMRAPSGRLCIGGM